MNWTFPVGRLFGISIRVHWILPISIAVYFAQAAGRQGTWGLEWMTVTTLIYLASVLIHEFAHCGMAIRLGGGAEQIVLWPLGGLSFVHHSGAPRDQIKVSVVGPLSNLLIAGASAGILLLTHAPWSWDYLNPFGDWWPYPLTTAQGFVLHALKLNLIIGLFQLCVPAYPLDGGQMLVAWLTMRHGRQRAAVVNSFIAYPIGIALAVWGFAMGDFLFGLIGVWVLYEAYQIRQLARSGDLDAHPAFAHTPEYDYMPDRERPRRKGWFARWRERRSQRARERELESVGEFRQSVDAILEKVSREGLGSLTADEKRILDEASKRSRGEP
jgi:Zn-dependent protease